MIIQSSKRCRRGYHLQSTAWSYSVTISFILSILLFTIAVAADSSIPLLHINERTRYIAVETPPSYDTIPEDTADVYSVEVLHNAMSGFSDELTNTRRILEQDDDMKGGDIIGYDDNGVAIHGKSNARGKLQNEAHQTNHGNVVKERSPQSNKKKPPKHHKSSNWWERLYQGGPLYDESTGKLIEDTNTNRGEDDSTIIPPSRRSHSASVYTTTNSHNEKQQYMIVSGGFTDDNWEEFPIWAYDLTNSQSISDIEQAVDDEMLNDLGYKWDKPDDKVLDIKVNIDSPWINLSQLDNEDTASDLVGSPEGRVGHLSSIHNDCLYIYGGLTYKLGSFQVDHLSSNDTNGESRESTLAIWKACGLDKLLSRDNNKEESDGEDIEDDVVGLKWEKIVPNVDKRQPKKPVYTATTDIVVNGDGTTSSGDIGNNEDTNENSSASDDQRKILFIHDIIHQSNRSQVSVEPPYPPAGTITPRLPSKLPRGEHQGGQYTDENGKDSFIFYGGMHHQTTLAEALEATTILGDVWRFDYETETLTMLAPYPPLPWQCDERTGDYPMARTAHAGTIVGDELIIHGGMYFGDENVHDSSSFSSPSNSYATYKTSSHWKALSDIWVFSLKTLKWRERIQYPQLARSYHSMVGWGNGTVAAFGGFQQDTNIPGETVAFVFKDLIVSRPNETYWQKLMPPYDETPVPHWRASAEYTSHPGITNRLEHSAVLDQYGSMYVWGGRFQSVSQIVGLFRLDVFTEDSNLIYENAPPDGIEQYEAELQALHMFIATMMFMSLTISSLFSMMRRQGADGGGGEGGGGVIRALSRRGLPPQVINALPLKTYQAPHHSEVTEDGDVVEDVSLSRENSRDETSGGLDDHDCCPICLVEYEDGVSEIRTLPCGHVFDKECIDSWLADHTTCPSCREDLLDNTALSTEQARASAINEQYEFDPRWQFISAFESSRRRHQHWGGIPTRFHQDIELVLSDEDGILDVSSLETTTNEETPNNDSEESLRPSFLRIRSFFNRRGIVGVAVPGEEEGQVVHNDEIELV